jgi:hypothetical protein
MKRTEKRTEKQILEELAQLRDQIGENTTLEDLISKAKEFEMGNVKDQETRTQVGSWIDKELWKHLRAQAALEGRNAGHVLDDAIRLYLAEKAGKSFSRTI